MAPIKSSLARSASKLLSVFRERDISLRGHVQTNRKLVEIIMVAAVAALEVSAQVL